MARNKLVIELFGNLDKWSRTNRKTSSFCDFNLVERKGKVKNKLNVLDFSRSG